MPTLSIVVPVFNVAEFLPQCLDSLLSDPSVDVQVVLVDDASTDGSGEIVDRYARSDQRVAAVHLPQNRGLGPARNAGLHRAEGDFVWFVDSDDWVSAGAVRRVLANLRDTDPEVLLLGHARVHGSSMTRLETDELLVDLPHTFTAADVPEILRLSPSAWNKVVRLTLYEERGLSFPEGAYEDVPVSLPLLCVASRISADPGVFVYYRMREGSIVRAVGDHHLHLIRQYELVLLRLDQLVLSDAITSTVYEVMVRQIFEVLRSAPMTEVVRRAFLADASVLVRGARPNRHRASSPLALVRDRVLRGGRLPVIDGLVAVHASVTTIVAIARSGARSLRKVRGSKKRFGIGALFRRAMLRLYYAWQRSRPVEPDLVVYSEYWGRQAGVCNPAAIHRAALRHAPHLRASWVVESAAVSVPPGAEAVVVGSRSYYRALARARYLVANANLGDEYVKRSGTTFVQTQHGTPLKSMGIDVRLQTPDEATRLLRRSATWDFCVSSNPHSSSAWRRAFPVDFQLMETGYPRNDELVRASGHDVEQARSRLGIDDGVTTILYAPTFRDGETAHHPRLDHESFARSLGPDHLLMLRAHYFYGAGQTPAGAPDNVVDASSPPIGDVCLATDVLITDYSSIMFDFAVLDRPIVIFAPDAGRYADIRGTYFDIESNAPGVVATDFEGLVDAFVSGAIDDEEARRRRTEFRARFCPWDDGLAADRVARAMIAEQEPTFGP